jgi:hypothetical protein
MNVRRKKRMEKKNTSDHSDVAAAIARMKTALGGEKELN